MTFKLEGAPRRVYGGGNTDYCLVKEANEVSKRRDELRATGDAPVLELWRHERKKLVKECHEVCRSFLLF